MLPTLIAFGLIPFFSKTVPREGGGEVGGLVYLNRNLTRVLLKVVSAAFLISITPRILLPLFAAAKALPFFVSLSFIR